MTATSCSARPCAGRQRRDSWLVRTMSWTPRRRRAGSVGCRVRAGEQLTERVPSWRSCAVRDNIAVLVAVRSRQRRSFVAEMNDHARVGDVHTTYTDPSGYDDGTVSTASISCVWRRWWPGETLRHDGHPHLWLPVAGEVTNTTPSSARRIVGMETAQTRRRRLLDVPVRMAHGERQPIPDRVVLGQRGATRSTRGCMRPAVVDRLAPNAAPLKHPACPVQRTPSAGTGLATGRAFAAYRKPHTRW